jgi:hypothetical protein
MAWSIVRRAMHLLRDDQFRVTDRVVASIEQGHLAGFIPRLAPDIAISKTALVGVLWFDCVRNGYRCIDGK